MKCDELKAYVAGFDGILHENKRHGDVYLKDDVDAAIAELKEFAEDACLERDDNQNAIDELQAENAELKQKLEDVKASHYAEMVDAGMRERRLRRALWQARADRAFMTLEYFTLKCRWFKDYMKVEPPKCDVRMIHKLANVERKCRAKAEEYK